MNKLFFSALCVLALTSVAGREAFGDTRYHVEEVLPQLHVLTQGDVFHVQPRGNVSVIEQEHGIVLVDSGGSPAGADQVISAVRALSSKPVSAIVLTHWHGDHVLGVSRLLQQWPNARVIATRETRDRLASRATDRYMPGDDDAANAKFLGTVRDGVAYLRQQSAAESLTAAERDGFAAAATEYQGFADEMAAARRVAPTETFEEHLSLPDRTTPLQVEFLGRANTAGDAIVWLPRQKVLITGDIVVAPIPFGADSFPREWVDVLRRLQDRHFNALVPGHGAPQHDGTYVQTLITALEDVRAQVAPFVDSTLDAAAVSARLHPGALDQRIAADDAWMRRWFRSYWQEPIVASVLREARNGIPH